MEVSAKEIEKNMGICGLVCSFCSGNKKCSGCRNKEDSCSIKQCCNKLGLKACFECSELLCKEGLSSNIRARAFNQVAKEDGIDKLTEYLKRNYDNGVTYHRSDGLKGDYDRLKTEQEIMDFLRNGKIDPYNNLPTYEGHNFLLRLVCENDINDLAECIGDPDTQKLSNDDNCSGYTATTALERAKGAVDSWKVDYKERYFVRFSIIDKHTEKAVGTIEIFPRNKAMDKDSKDGILRIDIVSRYEQESVISQLLVLADYFFIDFGIDILLTKAIPIPEAKQRIVALESSGYIDVKKTEYFKDEHYFVKEKRRL